MNVRKDICERNISYSIASYMHENKYGLEDIIAATNRVRTSQTSELSVCSGKSEMEESVYLNSNFIRIGQQVR